MACSMLGRNAGNEQGTRATVVCLCGVLGAARGQTSSAALKEQAGPFLQGVLLGGRSRCWTVIKLVISPINLNKI